ncbi:MAG: STAS domain-containing protein [Vicinamibacterales bacterium]
MTIAERAVGPAVVVLDISGRLVLGDGDTALKEAVSSRLLKGQRVVLNMAEVSYVDSAGLGVLVGTFLAAKNQGGGVKLLNPSKRLHDLLSMARLLKVVDICESEAHALESFGVAPS